MPDYSFRVYKSVLETSPSASRARAALAALAPLCCLAFLAGTAWLKIEKVEEVYGAFTRCYGCFVLPVLEHDSVIFASIIALYLAARVSKFIIFQWAFKFAAALVFGLYALDVFLIRTLATRLYLSDLNQYIGEGSAIASILREYILNPSEALPELLGLAACVFVLLFIFKREPRLSFQSAIALFAIPPLLLGVFLKRDEQFYVHAGAYLNFVEINLNEGWRIPYSDVFRRAMTEGREEFSETVSGEAKRPNVVFVLIESLSAYHSFKIAGLNDGTPLLDQLSASYLSFSHFYANGFHTQGGLYSILTGRLPFHDQAYSTDEQRTLPRLLNERGYRSYFLTSGDLEFGNKGSWLEGIGFDYVEGHDHPFYDGMQRYHFEAAADNALYNRALEKLGEIEAEALDEPYFLFLETVSTHHPYQNPETGKFDELGTFRYADREIKAFYDALRERGYFDDGGLLIITSDHRGMVPLTPEQVSKFGLGAVSRIPLIVIGEEFRDAGVVHDAYQQVDFLSTFASFTGETFCPSAWRGVLWGKNSRAPKCAFHCRGDNRSAVDMFCGQSEGQLELRGDEPRWLKQLTDYPELKTTAERIHFERLASSVYPVCR